MFSTQIRTAMVGACALIALSLASVAASAADPVKLQSVDVQTISGQQVQLRMHLDGPAPEPLPFTIDKPARIAFDLPNTSLYARHPTQGSEPNHFVATGILGLPFRTTFSTTLTLGTGPAVDVFDLSQGFDLAGHLKTGVINSAVYPPKTWGFGYRNLDLSLEKAIPTFGGTNLTVVGQMFNVGNWKNYGCLSSFLGPGGDPASLGTPSCVVSLGRREQIGLKLNF